MTNRMEFTERLSLPAICMPDTGADISHVRAISGAGVVAAFDAAMAGSPETLRRWISGLSESARAPVAVRLSAGRVGTRDELPACLRAQAPIVILSGSLSEAVCDAVHSYGGIVLYEAAYMQEVEVLAASGQADGIVLRWPSIAQDESRTILDVVPELRRDFGGLIAVSGVACSGESLMALQAMGADLGCIASRLAAIRHLHVGLQRSLSRAGNMIGCGAEAAAVAEGGTAVATDMSVAIRQSISELVDEYATARVRLFRRSSR